MLRCLLSLLIWLAISPAWAMNEDEAAVRATVNRYVAAMTTGDLAGLQTAFLPHGAFVTLRQPNQGSPTVVSQRFEEVLPGWAARAYPQARFTYQGVRMVEGRMALVEGILDLGPVRYADFLNLYKLGDAWMIAAKTTTTLPPPQ